LNNRAIRYISKWMVDEETPQIDRG
jgi:hypothetical protein